MRRLLVPLLLLASLALVAAGCGSATNDYRGKVSEVQKKYEGQLTDLTTKVTTQMTADPQAAGASLGELATVVNKFADEVAAVKAPSDKQALADKLVGAYRTLAQASLDLKTALASQDTGAMQKALDEFNKATADESAAIDAFNAAD